MTRILIDVEGIETAGRRLGALARAGRDLRPVFVQIGEYLIRSTRDRFRDQKSPEGVPWAPLSEAYARRKHPNRQRILTRHGDLQSQLSYRADSSELLFGSSLPYGGTHQFGARQGQYGMTGRGSPVPWGDIPARPWLGLSREDVRVIEDMVSDHLARAIG